MSAIRSTECCWESSCGTNWFTFHKFFLGKTSAAVAQRRRQSAQLCNVGCVLKAPMRAAAVSLQDAFLLSVVRKIPYLFDGLEHRGVGNLNNSQLLHTLLTRNARDVNVFLHEDMCDMHVGDLFHHTFRCDSQDFVDNPAYRDIDLLNSPLMRTLLRRNDLDVFLHKEEPARGQSAKLFAPVLLRASLWQPDA